jgi:hypothetical protein
MPENAVASAGTDGVGPGYTNTWGFIMITGFATTGLESAARTIGHITLEMKLTVKA